MRDLIPSKKQWSKWSLPSKLTTLGALFGILSNTIECTHKLKLSGNKLQNCNLKILNLVDIL